MNNNYLHIIKVLIFVCLFSSTSLFAQEKYEFKLTKNVSSFRLESCIPYNQYNPRLVIPRTFVEKVEPLEGTLMMVSGGRWENGCLIVELDQPITDEETIDFIMVFTILTKDQIIIK
jgi:hypothetical protein